MHDDRQLELLKEKHGLLLDEDDRRFMAFEIDNSIKNNKEYFTPLYADFNNPTIMRKVYEDLMKRDISKWDPINDRPITKLDHGITCESGQYIRLTLNNFTMHKTFTDVNTNNSQFVVRNAQHN